MIKKRVQFLQWPLSSPCLYSSQLVTLKGKTILLENKILQTFINSDFINWGDFRAMTGVLIKENRIPNHAFENQGNSHCWWKIWAWRFKEPKGLISHGFSEPLRSILFLAFMLNIIPVFFLFLKFLAVSYLAVGTNYILLFLAIKKLCFILKHKIYVYSELLYSYYEPICCH